MDYNKNYYEILGITKDATENEIKAQYRKLSKMHHPDVNKTGKDDKFKEISSAYSVLSDSTQKQEYDQRSPNGSSYSPFNQFSGNGFEMHFGEGSDIFNQFFGGHNPFGGFDPFQHFREEFRENLDINTSTTVNLKQIYLNENLNIKFKKYIHCPDCNGTGFDTNSNIDTCEICNGTGKNQGRTCEYCMGTGSIHNGQCKTCKGEKIILKDTEVVLQNLNQIRSNIRNAHRGYGHQSKYYRDKVGTLILNINVDRNDGYEIVNNYQLYKTIDIHFQDAIDGKDIMYKHIDDTDIKIKLPSKTKNDEIIRIKEKGLLKNDNLRDDLFLKINIIIDYDRI